MMCFTSSRIEIFPATAKATHGGLPLIVAMTIFFALGIAVAVQL